MSGNIPYMDAMGYHEASRNTYIWIFPLSCWLQGDDDAKDCQEDNWNQP